MTRTRTLMARVPRRLWRSSERIGTPDNKSLGARLTEPIDQHFTTTVSALSGSAGDGVWDDSRLTEEACLALFDAQLGSRHLDLAARWLRSQGKGYYTIGSAGRQGQAAGAGAVRPAGPAQPHDSLRGLFP